MKAKKHVQVVGCLRSALRRQCRPVLSHRVEIRLSGEMAPKPNWRNPLVRLVADQLIDGEVGDEN